MATRITARPLIVIVRSQGHFNRYRCRNSRQTAVPEQIAAGKHGQASSVIPGVSPVTCLTLSTRWLPTRYPLSGMRDVARMCALERPRRPSAGESKRTHVQVGVQPTLGARVIRHTRSAPRPGAVRTEAGCVCVAAESHGRLCVEGPVAAGARLTNQW